MKLSWAEHEQEAAYCPLYQPACLFCLAFHICKEWPCNLSLYALRVNWDYCIDGYLCFPESQNVKAGQKSRDLPPLLYFTKEEIWGRDLRCDFPMIAQCVCLVGKATVVNMVAWECSRVRRPGFESSCSLYWKWKSSHSVVSNSLQPHGQ